MAKIFPCIFEYISFVITILDSVSTLLTLVEEGFPLLRSDSRRATCCLPPPPTGGGRRYRPAVLQSACHAPRHSASPSSGVAGEPAGPAGCQLSNVSSHPPTSLVSPTATWASMVRGSVEEPACFKPQPAVSTDYFSALYEQCLVSGLKACVVFSHAAGTQVITVTCSLPTTFATASTVVRRCRRRRRRQRRRHAATSAGDSTYGSPSTYVAASAIAAPAGRDGPMPSSPEVTTPPAGRTLRRRNEVELLRDVDGEGDLLLSSLSCTTSPPPLSPSSPPRSQASFTAWPPLLPPAPLEHMSSSPPVCLPAPPEFPESPPPAESAPASDGSILLRSKYLQRDTS